MSGFVLHLRDQEVGGAVTSGHLYLTEGDAELDWNDRLHDFSALTPGNRVLVLLHGYNNNRSVGRTSLVRYVRFLARRTVTAVMLAVLWPGDGWAKALTYPFEGRDADDTADALFRWLTINVDASAQVSFVAHSLGCRVAMSTAQKLAQRGSSRGPMLERICLMAPAIDNDCLGRIGKVCFQETTLASQRIAVLASEEDEVLRFAYPLGDLTQTVLFGERWGRALGRTGPVERETRIVDKLEPVPKSDPVHNIDHGHYLDVKITNPNQTIALSEHFVSDFLAGAQRPVWPVQRP